MKETSRKPEAGYRSEQRRKKCQIWSCGPKSPLRGTTSRLLPSSLKPTDTKCPFLGITAPAWYPGFPLCSAPLFWYSYLPKCNTARAVCPWQSVYFQDLRICQVLPLDLPMRRRTVPDIVSCCFPGCGPLFHLPALPH